MESRAKLAGYAIHPMLITLPLVLLAALAPAGSAPRHRGRAGQDG